MKRHWRGSVFFETFGCQNKCPKSCAWSANIGGQKTENHFLARFIEKTKSQNVSPRARPQRVESEGGSSNKQTFSTCFWKLFLYSHIYNGVLNIHLQFCGLIILLNILDANEWIILWKNILDLVLNWILDWISFWSVSMNKFIFKTYRPGLPGGHQVVIK